MNNADNRDICMGDCPRAPYFYSVPGKCRSLQEVLKEPQTLRQSVLRMLSLLEELEQFHRIGNLHLDICPNNILLAGNGATEALILTQCAIPGGCALCCRGGYAAPELVNGQTDAADFSTDLYSVTAVFFHCLMGRKLTLREALLPKAPDGSDSPLLNDAPPAVRSIVRRILRKGLNVLPDKRYRSIGVLRRAFRELLETLDSQIKKQIP